MSALETDWTNLENKTNFYDRITPETLEEYAVSAGIATGCDIAQVYDDVKDARRVLEVGGGYGRTIDFLLSQRYPGEMHVIESSDCFVEHLRQKYQGRPISIYHQDVMDFQPPVQFDVVFSMWSGISDFPQNQQLHFLKKCASMLTENGKIILETPLSKSPIAVANYYENQSYEIAFDRFTAYGYIPSVDEVMGHVDELGCSVSQYFNYIAENRKTRSLYILLR